MFTGRIRRQKLLVVLVSLLSFMPHVASATGQTVSPTAQEPIKIDAAAGVTNLRKKPRLVYPPEARQLHIQGKVELELTVSPKGDVISERVISGPLALQEATIHAFDKVKYQPFLLNGHKSVALVQAIIDYEGDGATMSTESQPAAPVKRDDYGLGTGAHGRQAGGVEILSDTQGVDFGPYVLGVLQTVKNNWSRLIPKYAEKKKGRSTIELAITKDGKVAGMKLVATSGEPPLDRAAWIGIAGSNPFPPLPSDFKGPFLALRFRFFYNPDLLADIPTLQHLVELDPQSEDAWNNLGLAYLASHRTQEAITAFKKQIDFSHDGVYAYSNLGRAYWLNRQYEDAEAAFRKQLQVNPLDNLAQAYLGRLYLDWHKYNQAVEELEKATSFNSADLQVKLGTAYLNLGQDEKAMGAFGLAVKLSATPGVWNNIAYHLALRKSHLNLAQQYAQSAVATTSAALGSLNLDHLSTDDLSLVASLGSYWDTLGWVYFANDDLEKAERHVLSAWGLTQSSEVADHLGQIYEKRGEKARAIDAYALAMDGYRPPDPETLQRLSALVGGNDQAVAEAAQHREELSALRTVRMVATGPANASAVPAPLDCAGMSPCVTPSGSVSKPFCTGPKGGDAGTVADNGTGVV